jgi:type I restriction enzyme R subunit
MKEDTIEIFALETLKSLGYTVLFGPDIGPEGSGERESYSEVVLTQRLREALQNLNKHIPESAFEEAVGKVRRSTGTTLLLDNKDFHNLLSNGVEVEYRTESGEVKSDLVRLFDFEQPLENEFLAINQFTIIEGDINRRPDILLFVNGLPLAVIELKNATDAKADLKAAFNQIQTYKREISSLFRFNELCVISDGLDARVGTISANFERFMTWKTIDGEKEVGNVPMLEVLLRGVCAPVRILDIARNYMVFERDDSEKSYIKKTAAYHQYWAVNKAMQSTLAATQGDHRAGVVWHTQGSGKSLSMVFYTGKLIGSLELANPTIVVVTDRNDLDGQLFDTFANCNDLLRQNPVQAENRVHLRELLDREAGGVIFTTIQKFYPEDGENTFPVLTDRTNVVVMADEAHRSQYGFTARIRENDGEMVYGNAKYMHDALPNASYIGFTGTPIEFEDRSTPAVFGNYIDIYDIKQAVEDKATVPIYYESRLIDIGMDDNAREWLDAEMDALLEGEDMDRQQRLQAEWAQKEAIVGNSGRLELVAEDIVKHFEARQEAIDGKGMIVTMSRRIACDLYDRIVALRPEWHGDTDETGFIKVVITGSAADDEHIQKHVRSKDKQKALATRMKKADSDLKLVIVCDMWLTGFDVPNMHTMYLDKPLKGHNLMQAIARVNRVYPGKDGGLIVDYLGVARAMREALETYTQSTGRGELTLDIAEAVAIMKTKFEIVDQMYHGFNYGRYFEAQTGDQLQIILDAQEHILSQPEGEKRYKQNVLELSKAFALAMPRPEAVELREKVAFFQAVKARLEKMERTEGGPTDDDYRTAIRQIVDKAIAPVGVVDVFQAAGLDKPEFPILSDEFLAEIQGMQRKNLAVEALNKLLNDEIKGRFGKNAIKLTKFSELLEDALQRYKNGTIEAAQVVEMLVELAKEMRKEAGAAEEMGLSADEKAFYDALIENGSALDVLGDEKLRTLAQLLVQRIRNNIGVDWQYREPAKARLRVEVKKLLQEFGYPPDEQAVATQLVLEQAKLYAEDWSKE